MDGMSGSTSFVAKMRDAELLSSEVLVAEPKRFVHEVLRMPDDEVIDWYYVDTQPSVMVVPVTADGQVVLVKQYRHNLKRDTLELPAGIVDKGEDIETAAIRELAEETGYGLLSDSSLVSLGSYYSLPSETNKICNLFLAAPVVQLSDPRADTVIEKYFDMGVRTMPLSQALLEMGRSIQGLETLAALLLAQHHLPTTP
jgi:8-oxo-dGTP pyrophosphatase MutT (NUDIX family)